MQVAEQCGARSPRRSDTSPPRPGRRVQARRSIEHHACNDVYPFMVKYSPRHDGSGLRQRRGNGRVQPRNRAEHGAGDRFALSNVSSPPASTSSAGVGEGMGGYDFSADAQDTASGIESALQTALTGESLKSAGSAAAQGLGNAMTAYPMADTGRTLAANMRSAVQASLNGNTLRSAGVNVMAGLRAGILAGRFRRNLRHALCRPRSRERSKEGTENQESFAGISG